MFNFTKTFVYILFFPSHQQTLTLSGCFSKSFHFLILQEDTYNISTLLGM